MQEKEIIGQAASKRTCVIIMCLLTAALLCGCSYRTRMANTTITVQGNNTYVDVELEPQLFSTGPVTAVQKEAQYMSYLEEQIQTALETMSSVDTAEVSIAQNEAKLAVDVRLTLSESAGKSEDIEEYNEYIAEIISKFFEEEIDLTIELQ